MIRAAAALVVGLLMAALAEFLALGVGGAGHGWIAPSAMSIVLFIVYPLVLVRLSSRSGKSIRGDLALGVFALAADVFFLVDILRWETDYVLRVLGSGGSSTWIALWLLWQALVGVTIAIRLRRRGALDRSDPLCQA